MNAEFPLRASLGTSVRIPREEPGAPLVIALHGRGMTERAFERWLRPGIGGARLTWWLPRGILPYETEASRRIGYAWYVFDGDQEALRVSMDEACAHLVRLTAIAVRYLRPSRIALLGFSQGAYLASYLALSRPDLYGALVCCAGRPKAEFVADLQRAAGLRILVQTGSRDASVPPDVVARGVAPLRVAGLDVTERSYDCDHRLTPEMAADAAAFLA